ncbi:Nuclear pore complex protein [Thalictrum thalictroides]|uniref:Nuclear pore complex protein n=1 Tax=Thalictrum thalictroides TaxID=46969 RepID=A0A7J6URK4_THATH|nr:Nuclear pore complex protein [Thalictrum thalictroides]
MLGNSGVMAGCSDRFGIISISTWQTGDFDGKEIDLSPGHGDEALQSVGTESWPRHVLRQQPRDLSALFQKLHSGY